MNTTIPAGVIAASLVAASLVVAPLVATGSPAAAAQGTLPVEGTAMAALAPAKVMDAVLRPGRSASPSWQGPLPVASRPACNAQKYHGEGVVIRYDPDDFKHTPEYLKFRDPNRPTRAEAARIADERFADLVTPKVVEMLRLANQVRRSRGHTEMKLEPRLTLAAKRHNIDIAKHGLMQHTGTDCSQLKDRVWEAGYTWTKIAENLAGGNESASTTMAQWTGSKRHLEQLTLPYMTEVGIAYDHNPNPPRNGLPIKHFWTLILARPDPWRDRRDLPEKFEDELEREPDATPSNERAPKRSTQDQRKTY